MKFYITYALSGNRMVEVTIPEGTELPSNWKDMSVVERDEWIYSVQSATKLQWEDIDYAEAQKILYEVQEAS